MVWRVRVWDANSSPSDWSTPSTWTLGLLNPLDWQGSRWIEYPARHEMLPMPLFAHQFEIPSNSTIRNAYLYLSGVGTAHATVNGQEITDEVLTPGYSNYQLSSGYRTYDIAKALRAGLNTAGVSLGNGPSYVRRSVTNPSVGRNAPYSWWQSQLKGYGNLVTDLQLGGTSANLNNVTGYRVGGSINLDTGRGGSQLESRVITSIDNITNTITFEPDLAQDHQAGSNVTGSGNNIAASDPSAGTAVTPRVIGRIEITYQDGSNTTIPTDAS